MLIFLCWCCTQCMQSDMRAHVFYTRGRPWSLHGELCWWIPAEARHAETAACCCGKCIHVKIYVHTQAYEHVYIRYIYKYMYIYVCACRQVSDMSVLLFLGWCVYQVYTSTTCPLVDLWVKNAACKLDGSEIHVADVFANWTRLSVNDHR